MFYLAMIYLAGSVLYSIHISRRFEGQPVPLWKILVYSAFCPYFFVTNCICSFLSYFGIHIMYFFTIEVNTSEDNQDNPTPTDISDT